MTAVDLPLPAVPIQTPVRRRTRRIQVAKRVTNCDRAAPVTRHRTRRRNSSPNPTWPRTT